MKNFLVFLLLLGLMNMFVCSVILNEVKDLPLTEIFLEVNPQVLPPRVHLTD